MSREIEISLLKAFLAISEEGSFSKAANRLNISQPVLSQRIKRLEDILSLELFERTASGSTLTLDGVEFHVDAKQILESHNLIIGKYTNRSNKRRLNVNISADCFFPRLYKLFTDELSSHFDLHLESIENHVPISISEFNLGAVDIYIGELRPTLSNSCLIQTVFEAEHSWIANAEFLPLAQPVPIALYHEDCDWNKSILDTFSENQVAFRIRGNFDTLYSLQTLLNVESVVVSAFSEFAVEPFTVLEHHTSFMPPNPKVKLVVCSSNPNLTSLHQTVVKFFNGIKLVD